MVGVQWAMPVLSFVARSVAALSEGAAGPSFEEIGYLSNTLSIKFAYGEAKIVPLDIDDACMDGHLDLALNPRSCRDALASLRAQVLAERTPKEIVVSEEELADAGNFARRMFNAPQTAFIKAVEPRDLESKLSREGRQRKKSCMHEHGNDDGSVMRCLAISGYPVDAVRFGEDWISRHDHAGLHNGPESLRITMMLIQFGSAYLMDRLLQAQRSINVVGDTADELDKLQRVCVERYRRFASNAGRMHIYNDQLGNLLMHAYARLQKMDDKHADHYLVVIDTSPGFGIATLDPKRDTRFAVDMHDDGHWEWQTTSILAHILRQSGKRRATFVDVGANLGWFTLFAASKGANVVAFEPVKAHCWRLRQSLAFNGFGDHVALVEGAVKKGARQGDVLTINAFSFGPSPTAYVCFSDSGAACSGASVPAISVDVGFAQVWRRLSRGDPEPAVVDVLKIDAEGCEIDALLSARDIVERHRPELLLEVCPSFFRRCMTTREDEVESWNMLWALGYRTFMYMHDAGKPAHPLTLRTVRLPNGLGSAKGHVELPLWEIPREDTAFNSWIDAERQSKLCFQLWSTLDDKVRSRQEL
eukprot:TRINITY_DN55922_c0_g1_i1.p1 TRINITY_DN55922_c0_g1~~TRINITY_DN55922_c0_g1_i1.p1  ORF type:complete len:602 (+),score=74.98 TRINITY_DN55922_c0_g1_i1:44-1807(+)